ncbi:nuclear transport factor 2 family protein [Chitinophaga sp. LS1]|uniref:nuclear transport factor 2 family protein n=1 Tax=Chitinophaga sp. LS1 TaxID=3051176 RepID=UPI002AAB7885|nr:nuclear transport factor 2 family protein [Chitinophaga sp. LS1]WPV64056.1 nuclear transport factor 2 family protein [Chitinophaga sp. LS1]
MNMKELADKLALRELVDTLSILGDKKDVHAQVQLFTDDAISETFIEGVPILKLKGRKEMEAAFINFLKDFDTIYHFNGQQKVIIDGDTATGTCYCQITLIGAKVKTTIGAIYYDNYIFVNNQWLIAKRIGIFEWQEKQAF